MWRPLAQLVEITVIQSLWNEVAAFSWHDRSEFSTMVLIWHGLAKMSCFSEGDLVLIGWGTGRRLKKLMSTKFRILGDVMVLENKR